MLVKDRPSTPTLVMCTVLAISLLRYDRCVSTNDAATCTGASPIFTSS